MRFEPRVWTCGNRFPAKPGTVGAGVPDHLRQVSRTFCSMPAKRWTKCGGPSSSAKEEQHGIWYGGSAGCFLSSWLNLDRGKRRHQLNALFALNRRILKANLLKESRSHLWDYSYEGAQLRYLQKWIDQLRWPRLKPMEKLAQMLLDHLEGILNYCRTKVPMGVVEAVNGNIKALLRRGRGYRDMNYLLLKCFAALGRH